MTRQSFQKGYVSDPIRTRRGIAFKIRYRMRTAEGKWKQKPETLYGIKAKGEARRVLGERLREVTRQKSENSKLTLRDFVTGYWKAHLDRICAKPSTRMGYDSALNVHILPALGDLRLADVEPLHIEKFVQAKEKTLSKKSVRNLVGLLQGLFSLALENDLIERSPVRDKHKPKAPRPKKEPWAGEQVRMILENAPEQYRALFAFVANTGVRLGELLGLQWQHVDLKERKLKIEQSRWQGQVVTPKTEESGRTIALGEVLALEL
ncbi:MAG: tyrosine-type recombinase/integrase [Acidobacteria bacterium]|nr:tyrosine-type recombinase/integrase [Acidobacteriota bacterium]